MWGFYQYGLAPAHYTERTGAEPKEFEQYAYDSLLEDFARDTQAQARWHDQQRLWERVRSDCESCLRSYRVEELLSSLFGTPPAALVVVPTPLDPATFGFGVRDQTAWYALLGPPAVRPEDEQPVSYLAYGPMLRELCVHEFAHFFWQDAEKQCPSLPELSRTLQSRITPKAWFGDMYSDWPIQFEEILVRASVAFCISLADGDQAGQTVLAEESRKFGIGLVAAVYAWLKDQYAQHHQLSPDLLGQQLPNLIAYLSKQ